MFTCGSLIVVLATAAADPVSDRATSPSPESEDGVMDVDSRAPTGEKEDEALRVSWVLGLAVAAGSALGLVTGPVATGGLALSGLLMLVGGLLFAPVFLALPLLGFGAIGGITLGLLAAAAYLDPDYEHLYWGAAAGGGLGILAAVVALPVGSAIGAAVAVGAIAVGVYGSGVASRAASGFLWLAGLGLGIALAGVLPAAAFGGGIAAGLFLQRGPGFRFAAESE